MQFRTREGLQHGYQGHLRPRREGECSSGPERDYNGRLRSCWLSLPSGECSSGPERDYNAVGRIERKRGGGGECSSGPERDYNRTGQRRHRTTLPEVNAVPDPRGITTRQDRR